MNERVFPLTIGSEWTLKQPGSPSGQGGCGEAMRKPCGHPSGTGMTESGPQMDKGFRPVVLMHDRLLSDAAVRERTTAPVGCELQWPWALL
jgi:hypothetical protein